MVAAAARSFAGPPAAPPHGGHDGHAHVQLRAAPAQYAGRQYATASTALPSPRSGHTPATGVGRSTRPTRTRPGSTRRPVTRPGVDAAVQYRPGGSPRPATKLRRGGGGGHGARPTGGGAASAADDPLFQSLLPRAGAGSGRREEDLPRFSEQDLAAMLREADSLGSEACTRNVHAQWLYETDVNPATQLHALQAQLEYGEFQRELARILRRVPEQDVSTPALRRQLHFLRVAGPSALPAEQLERYNRLINDMLAVYNGASICAHEKPFQCGLTLQPALTLIMARSRDWEELQHVWMEWRRHTGQRMRDLFEQLVALSNDAARANGLHDFAEYWMYPYESDAGLRFDVQEAWDEVRPLYEQLHAYVRRKLRDLYGPDKISRQAPLPEHILGNMWGQSWSNILDITVPYPGKNFVDVTPQMLEQGYTPLAMFKLAEDFYLSMNMSLLPNEFWAGSVLEAPPDRPVVVKMCTEVNMRDLVTAHHELGHIQYFLNYRHLPKVFRDGANPGFHEAVGEAVALSVQSPQHLQTLGLVHKATDDLPHTINYLFAMALDKLPFLAFSYVLDRWRWDIFEGSVTKLQYNCHFWRLRERISGVKPPLLRSEIDFDPGSKYHVPANVPYIR
ncbi:Angiotensin-converting enzyme [Gryllus bimaculatus]|nr:Angiotensin-converting enzyme [Gryllus bimaculatus]